MTGNSMGQGFCIWCGEPVREGSFFCGRTGRSLAPKERPFRDYVIRKCKGKAADTAFDLIKKYLKAHFFGTVLTLTVAVTAVAAATGGGSPRYMKQVSHRPRQATAWELRQDEQAEENTVSAPSTARNTAESGIPSEKTRTLSEPTPPAETAETIEAAETQTTQAEGSTLLPAGEIAAAGNTLYYWRYTRDSLESPSLFASFPVLAGAPKALIANRDGTEETVLEAAGTGILAVVRGTIFYMEKGADGYDRVLSYRPETGETAEYGRGTILGADPDAGRVVLSSYDADLKTNVIASVSVPEGERRVLFQGTLLAIHDGRIYYEGPSETAQRSRGSVSLRSVSVEGGDDRELFRTPANFPYEIANGYCAIMQLYFPTIDGIEYAYFSYGSIAGTGMFYQGGGIARARLDGGGGEQVSPEGELVNKYFSVNPDGSIVIGEEEYMLEDSMNLSLQVDGSYYVFEPSDGSRRLALTSADLISSEGESPARVSILGYDGVRVYYRCYYGVRDPGSDLGWREAYALTGGFLAVKDLETGTVTVLSRF